MASKDVIIIGAGPAGIACAIQLRRYGIATCIIERDKVGGLLRNARLVENYPGFPQGISGSRLADLLRIQLEQSQAELRFDCVESVNYSVDLFTVETASSQLSSPVLVIASGTKPVEPEGVVISASVLPKVFFEIVPLAGVEHKHILIVGAGDAAFDYALNLADRNEVTIINRGRDVKCLPLLWERAQNHPRIAYHPATAILELTDNSSDQMLARCATSEGCSCLETDYVVFAIGREPAVDFMRQDSMACASSLEDQGLLYLIGDVCNGIERQTTIAVGDGIRAAMKISGIMKERTR